MIISIPKIKELIGFREHIFNGEIENLPQEVFEFINDNHSGCKSYYIDDVQVLIRMNYNGTLCGYVVNPQIAFPNITTTYLRRHYDKFNAHGFINYFDSNRYGFADLPKDYFLFGFDCGHMCDYLPNLGPASPLNENKPFRDELYVHNQLVDLLKQLRLLNNQLTK